MQIVKLNNGIEVGYRLISTASVYPEVEIIPATAMHPQPILREPKLPTIIRCGISHLCPITTRIKPNG
jgi:hypothetical protein